MDTPDNEPLVAGTYEIRDGKRVLVVEPTKDHPEGNRPRDAAGKPIPTAIEPDAQRELDAAAAAKGDGK